MVSPILKKEHYNGINRKQGRTYKIKVFRFYKANRKHVPQKMTWTSEPNMTAKQIEKELQRQSVLLKTASVDK